MKDKRSSVIRLLDEVWTSTNAGTSHSYERLNHAMRAALTLAIGAGFEFAEDDISHIMTNYRSGYWVGEREWIYSLAVCVENSSAYKSYEKCAAREPVIADGVTIRSGSGFTHGNYMNRQRERLCVGAELEWMGENVEVTSVKGDYVVACSYKPSKKGKYSKKINKRYSIGKDDVIRERADKKKRKALADKLQPYADKAVKLLKAKNMKAFYALPIKKIEAVLKQLTGE